MSVRLLNAKILNRHISNERLENGGKDHRYSTLHDDGEDDERKDEDDDSSQLTSDDLTGGNDLHQLATEGAVDRVRQCLKKLMESHDDWTKIRDAKNSQGYNALHLAARYNRKNVVNCLLEHGALIDTPDSDDYNTSLLLAAKYNMASTAKFLLEKGADPTRKNKYGTTALHFAARTGNVALTRTLLDLPGVNVNETDNIGSQATPLHHAMLSGSTEITKMLLEKGADVNAADVEGERPIHYAAAEDAGDLIVLLAKGALRGKPKEERRNLQIEFVNTQSKEKDTALHVAAQAGYEETVKTLVSIGADVNKRTDTKQTPLHLAAISGQANVVRYLVMHHANINAKDEDFMTPLHRACLFGRLEVVRFLKERGARIDDKDKDNFTPLLCAVWKGQDHVIEYLLDNDANIELTDSSSKSVLHLAVEDGHNKTLELLIQKGGKKLVNWTDKDYKTPLHCAASSGNEEAINLLLNNGCEVDKGDNEEKTPLHIAAENGHLESVLILGNAAPGVLNASDERGRSPVHLSAMNGHIFTTETLIDLGAETSCRDDVNWTPLDYAAGNGFSKTVTILLENDAFIDACDANGTTPLHHASANGHVNCIEVLLNNHADIQKRDKFGKNCLDLAVEHIEIDACMAIVKHKRWREAFTDFNKEPGSFHPMDQLIKVAPEVAEVVLDYCIQYSPHEKKHPDYTIECNFELLELPPDEQMADPYFAPATMVKCHRDKLLSHPLVLAFINHKWGGLGRWIYLLSFLMYVLFVTIVTIFIVTEKYQQHKHNLRNNGTISFKDECEDQSTFATVIPWLTILLAAFQILKEIMQLGYYRWQYIKDWENIFEFCLYASTFLFVLPFIMCQVGKDPNTTLLHDLKWQAGAICILFSWFNLLLHLKRFPYFGLYVVMFVEVMKTLFNVLFVFFIMIVGFALSFYALLKEQAPFNMPGRAIVKTTVMMIGELEFDAIFVENYNNKKMLRYKEMSLIIFFLFVILMTIVVMNLLVGLAVGDIESVRKNAYLRILKAQVHIIRVFENSYPKLILRMIFKDNTVIQPNLRGVLGKFYNWIGKYDYESLKDEQLEMGGKEDLIAHEVEAQKKEIKRQKDKMKTLIAMLEEQTAYTQKIAQKLQVSGRTA